MISAVCTLFEKHFHNGVAALVNSLYNNGFRGDFYAGYRGTLPKWTLRASENATLNWPGAKTLQIGEDLQVHFLPLTTDYPLVFYKPHFMLSLLNGPARDAHALAYFDSDIVNLCHWSFYERWMTRGVAMVHEVVTNDMPANHPIRMEWHDIIRMIDRKPKREIYSYINAGFCGVSIKYIEFLQVWLEITELALKDYGTNQTKPFTYDRPSTFFINPIDQDAFNIAAMCCESPISEMGPDAMDFVGVGWTMSHATGSPKPWEKKFVLSALKGNPPSRQDKHYWNNIYYPINLNGNIYTKLIKGQIAIGKAVGKFIRRN